MDLTQVLCGTFMLAELYFCKGILFALLQIKSKNQTLLNVVTQKKQKIIRTISNTGKQKVFKSFTEDSVFSPLNWALA